SVKGLRGSASPAFPTRVVSCERSQTNRGGGMPESGTRRATGRHGAPVMMDVAALAGVSYQTVSRVINDQPGVRDSTRERVLAAMRELGYRPSPAARSLASGRSRTIGIVTIGTDLYGPATTLRGVETA